MSEFSHMTLFNMSAVMEMRLQISAWRSEAKLPFSIPHVTGHVTQVGSVRALYLQITVTNLPWSSFMTDSLCTAVPSTWNMLHHPPTTTTSSPGGFPLISYVLASITSSSKHLSEWSSGVSIAFVGPTSFPI